MEQPKVSVIVPSYEAEKYLPRCLDSLLGQTHTNLEILCIDDGSTDNSFKVLQRYAAEDSRVIILRQSNGGVARARNVGLSKATGEYILFLDSDDWLDINTIETMISAAEKYNAEAVRFKLRYEYDNGFFYIEDDDFPDGSYFEKSMFGDMIYMKFLTGIKMNSICRTLFKGNVLKNLRFREDIETAEDVLFSIEAFTNAQSFLYLSLPYYHYFQTNVGITGNGISLLKKYICNWQVSLVLASKLKIWGMNSVKYKILAYTRIIRVTLSKIKRRAINREKSNNH